MEVTQLDVRRWMLEAEYGCQWDQIPLSLRLFVIGQVAEPFTFGVYANPYAWGLN